jgi:WD40 repeat protein
MSYTVEKHIPFECQQSNKIIFHENTNLLATGHEDRQIRFFDPNQNKLAKSIVAHTDSVSCLSVGLKEYELLSASHDGSVRCWDMRIYKLLFDIPAHRKKYDEGCLSINTVPNEKLIITSGADGLIKVFKLNN